jgi:AraC-like DNA-binding protein
MKKHNHDGQSVESLARAAARLPEPRNYFGGRRHPHLELPDNVLLFFRGSAAELGAGSLQPNFHHRWVMVVSLQGAGTVRVDEREYRLTPGGTLLLPPLRLHGYRDVSKGALAWMFLTFELPDRDAQSAKPEMSRLTTEACVLLHDIVKAWQDDDAGDTVNARLSLWVALLLCMLRHETPARLTASPSLLERVNQWIAEHQREPFSLSDLAGGVGLSVSHLRALFRKQCGLSLGRYVRETRCRLAALRLREEMLTVSEVAAAYGFRSVYSFSRTFKRVLGVPPSQLTQSIRR